MYISDALNYRIKYFNMYKEIYWHAVIQLAEGVFLMKKKTGNKSH